MARGLRWAVNCTEWLPSKQEWLTGLAFLQPEEAERVSKFVFRKDAKLALVGRLLMRAGLSDLLQVKPMHLQFSRGEKGKPLLISSDGSSIDERIGFNISHQGDYTVFAAERGSQVGVDVMQLSIPRGESIPSFFETMRRQFTEREWQQIKSQSLSPQEQLNNFYRFWCLKESFIKAEGTGLTFGLQNLEFIVEPDEEWPPINGMCCTGSQLYIQGWPAQDNWVFQESTVNQQHCVAVAMTRGQSSRDTQHTPLVFSKLTIHELLSKLHPFAPPPTSRLVELLEDFMIKKEKPVYS